MWEAFTFDKNDFSLYSFEHLIVLIIILIGGIYFNYSGKHRWDVVKRRKYAFYLATAMAVSQFFKMFIRIFLGNFSHETDLPLHLCSIMPFVLMYIFYTENKKIWAIFFFWMMAGTAQALFTGTITDRLPHYEAIRYWLVHGGCVILSIYGFYVYNWKLKYSDVLKAAVAMNVAAAVIYPINVAIGSNYFFLNAKPGTKTLYSLLPEWPTYILCLEGVILILFSVVYFLFMGPSLVRKLVGSK